MDKYGEIRSEMVSALGAAYDLTKAIGDLSLGDARSPLDVGDDLATYMEKARAITKKIELARDMAYSLQLA